MPPPLKHTPVPQSRALLSATDLSGMRGSSAACAGPCLLVCSHMQVYKDFDPSSDPCSLDWYRSWLYRTTCARTLMRLYARQGLCGLSCSADLQTCILFVTYTKRLQEWQHMHINPVVRPSHITMSTIARAASCSAMMNGTSMDYQVQGLQSGHLNQQVRVRVRTLVSELPRHDVSMPMNKM